MNEKQTADIISQLKKQNNLLEEILKELKGNETDVKSIVNDDVIPELLENEKQMAFAHVIKNGYIYTFCYGRYVDHKKATAQECYMYRDANPNTHMKRMMEEK